MKRFLVLLAFLTIPAIALANGLPDYKKDGKLSVKWSCDNGKTAVNVYDLGGYDTVIEFLPTSGDVLIYFNDDMYIKLSGTTELKKVSEEEFYKLFEEKAPATYNFEQDAGPSDCKRVQ